MSDGKDGGIVGLDSVKGTLKSVDRIYNRGKSAQRHKRGRKVTITLQSIMLHRIERGDSVDLAQEFGIVTTHTFDGVRQKFTALCTKAPAVVARSGVLPKNPLINAKN